MARLRPKPREVLDVYETLLEDVRTEVREAERTNRLIVPVGDGTDGVYVNPVRAELARLERGDPVDLPGSTIASIYLRAQRDRPAWLASARRYRLFPDGTVTPVDPPYAGR